MLFSEMKYKISLYEGPITKMPYFENGWKQFAFFQIKNNLYISYSSNAIVYFSDVPVICDKIIFTCRLERLYKNKFIT